MGFAERAARRPGARTAHRDTTEHERPLHHHPDGPGPRTPPNLHDDDLRRLAGAFSASATGYAVLDERWRVRAVNAAGAAALRVPADELPGRPLSQLVPEPGRRELDQELRRMGVGGPGLELELRFPDPDGGGRTVRLRVTGAATGGGVVQIEDVTERRRRERTLEELATLDDLTGLRNRRTFRAAVAHHLALGARHGHAGALLLVDVDGFKSVNDWLGHAAGDRALAAIARAIGGAVRATDVVGRVGGDEFAVLLPRGGPSEGVRVALGIGGAVRDAVDATLSTGVAPVVDGVDVDGLFDLADRAMYAAKAAGGDTTHVDRMVEVRVAHGQVVRSVDRGT